MKISGRCSNGHKKPVKAVVKVRGAQLCHACVTRASKRDYKSLVAYRSLP